MKKIILCALCVFALGATDANAQSKKEMKKQMEQMQQQMQQMQQNQQMQQGYPQQQMQGYPQQQMQGYPQQQMQGYPQQQMQGYPQQQMQGYPQQQMQGYPQQQMQGYPQQQMMQGYPQQQMMQGYPQQGQQMAGDGYSEELQQTRIERMMFADPQKLRAIGEAESREKQSAMNIAEVAARAQMQRQIETFTKDGMERYRKETAMNDAEKYQANDEQLAQTVAKGIQTGCRVVDMAFFYNKTTKKYKCQLLVEYDKAGVVGLLESQEAAIMANRDKFEAHMQNVFDEYELEKTGTTAAMRKQMAEDAVNNARLDAEAARKAADKQQDADNRLRQMESNQNYNLDRQKQGLDAATQMHQQRMDRDVMRTNSRTNKQ